jgi:26S proteasome regulatory subunit T1
MLSQLARPCSIHTPLNITRRQLAIHVHRTPEPASPEVSQLVDNYTKRPAKPLRLSKLLAFARPVTPESVLESVEYVQSEIPRRMASRVAQIEALPFIVGTNPYIAKTLHACRKSFLWLATQPKVTSLEQNQEYTQHLATLVENHSDDIPTMARGYAFPFLTFSTPVHFWLVDARSALVI